jgi:hypothetical protein
LSRSFSAWYFFKTISPTTSAAQKKIIAKAPSATVARECIVCVLNGNDFDDYIKKRPRLKRPEFRSKVAVFYFWQTSIRF